jgi:hypothetical protein
MSAEDPCSEDFVGYLKESVAWAHDPWAKDDWSAFANLSLTLQQKAPYGEHPYILIYGHGYESIRGIAWNPKTRRFDVIAPGGLW